MDEKNDGGSAFPREHNAVALGMTMRDYFAAKAMQGLIAEPQWREGGYALVYILGPQTKDDAENYAVTAYRLADAMLKARTHD